MRVCLFSSNEIRFLHLIPPHIPFLANLLPMLAGGDAELALVGQIEIIGRAETGSLRHIGHAEVGVAFHQHIAHIPSACSSAESRSARGASFFASLFL